MSETSFLLNHVLLQESFEAVRKYNIKAALDCGPRDDEGRRRHLDAARIVDSVVNHLKALLEIENNEAKAAEMEATQDFYSTKSARYQEHWASIVGGKTA